MASVEEGNVQCEQVFAHFNRNKVRGIPLSTVYNRIYELYLSFTEAYLKTRSFIRKNQLY